MESSNSEILAEMWGDFIDWSQRLEGPDAQFLIEQLRNSVKGAVLDAALGDGINTIQLQRQNFKVTSNEIDDAFLQKALQNAKRHETTLNVTNHDWRDMDKHLPPESFGSVICLGNSLTYLFTEAEQLKALKNFRGLLKQGGRLIVDERNYQYVLDNRDQILAGDFRYSGKYVYHGQKVHTCPISISDDKIMMEYAHSETGKKGYLTLYPFKKGELLEFTRQAGFADVTQFSDYAPGYNPEADFHQYVCVK
jgi:SAM-dependent methyltransferase